MRVIYNPSFASSLKDILKFIADDKPSASLKFKNELKIAINNLLAYPYKYRKSYYFNDENIRDMTYKKYTIVYEINHALHTIEILKIFNKNKPSS